MPEPLLSVEDLAARLGVPIGTVYAWNHKGTGPRRVRVGKHIRYTPADVDAWIEAQYADRVPAA